MSAMTRTSSGFRAALVIGWTALCVAGIIYARSKGIPARAWIPALAAITIEYPFYLATGFSGVREHFAREPLPGYLLASAVLPYLAACAGAVQFQLVSLLKLIALAAILGLWFRLLPASRVTDLAFLAAVAAAKIGRFTAVYQSRYHGLDPNVLGDLALLQIAVMALVCERRVRETGYGFWPTPKDWRIGVMHFLYFAPAGALLGFGLHAVRFGRAAEPWKIAAYFFGWLFVLALSEEFFFRGVLQQWFEEWMKNRSVALVVTSTLFGAVHLWFRQFPNWKWVAIAGTMGWFCGRARNQAGSIRAAMVTHTLVITAWRAFLSG
jgi:membrane protease YdiL (CAAX protease family)